MDCKVRGFYTCSYLGVVSEVKVLGQAGRYRGVEDESKSVFSSILLGFHCKLNFFIVYSWYLISYKVHLYSSFTLITCSWILFLIVPLSLGTNTPFSYKKLWKSCIIFFFTETYVSFIYLIKSSLIYSYNTVLLYLLSL